MILHKVEPTHQSNLSNPWEDYRNGPQIVQPGEPIVFAQTRPGTTETGYEEGYSGEAVRKSSRSGANRTFLRTLGPSVSDSCRTDRSQDVN